MTAKDYTERGYRLSLQTQQSEIERAERDVMYAYMQAVIYHTEDEETFISEFLNNINNSSADDWNGARGVQYRAFAGLVVLLLMQRKAVATRSGAKVANVTSTSDTSSYDTMQQMSRECYMYLEKLKESNIAVIGGNVQALRNFCKSKVSDICGIYFKLNFFNM